jgi:exopolyphosphatase / guanosine-5'-triphosphate,3'-diphosphate pyrophosphatase
MSPTSYQTAPPRVATHVLAKIEASSTEVRTRDRGLEVLPRAAAIRLSDGDCPAGRPGLPCSLVRGAVLDVGSNSTRLLIADVDATAASVREVLRRSEVTRLGDGVDATGSLSDRATRRVMDTLTEYRKLIDEHRATANIALFTSAVREAANGSAFAARVHAELGFDTRVLTGDEEAWLTFRGATADMVEDARPPHSNSVVIDIGGGSTEFVVGAGRKPSFHTSLPVGVVRMSERHIRSDPPAPQELQALTADTRAIFGRGLPQDERDAARQGIAVAGTATSAAAIDQRLEPYDPSRVHGYRLALETVEELLARLAAMNEHERRRVPGLDPDRAPTIVAGLAILAEALRAFALSEVTVSEHDILFGGALLLADAA